MLIKVITVKLRVLFELSFFIILNETMQTTTLISFPQLLDLLNILFNIQVNWKNKSEYWLIA